MSPAARSTCVLVTREWRYAFADGSVTPRQADEREPMVMTNGEVVCVDVVDGVDAIGIRHARTGYLDAVNASALVSCNGST